MAIRTRAVRPDMVFELEDGRQVAVVSEESLLQATVDVARTVNFAGGTMSLVVNRHPTGVPHEMVTVGALIQWQDRTDAKAQPEPAAPAREVEQEDEPDWSFEDKVVNTRTGEEFAVEGTSGTPMEFVGPDPEPEALEAALEEQAVVIGAPVGAHVGPQNFETPHVTETRVPRTEGVGSGALPFQRDGAPGAPPPEIDLKDIAHGNAGAPARGASAAPAGSSEGIDDGFVAEAEEDDSSIPEHLRD